MSNQLLNLSKVSVGYSDTPILSDIDLALETGTVTLLGGRNGAGKSTLLKGIMGLLTDVGGTITFNNESISGPNQQSDVVDTARLGLGYVPETRRIFASLTVAENLEAGRRDGQGPRWSIQALLELFPPLTPLMARRAGALSGGEQQMLSIARTLAGQPKLLLLDEASEGLAPLVVNSLSNSLKSMASSGLTILMAEQNWRFAKDIANRVIILDQGVIAFDDDMDVFNADTALQDRLLGAQSRQEG